MPSKYPVSESAFTLIELMVVISIIAILSVIGFVYYGNFIKNSRDAKRQADLKFIQSALEDYHADQLYYPSTITFGAPLILGSKTYANMLPDDPKPPPDYSYAPSPAGCSSQCTGYCLYAHLEGASLPNSDAPCPPSSPYNFGVTRP